MQARPGRQQERQRNLGQALGAALIVFAILCAMVVVLAAPGGAPAEQQEAARPSPLLQVLGELDAAREELDTSNFGQARRHLQQARSLLSDLLPAAQQEPQ